MKTPPVLQSQCLPHLRNMFSSSWKQISRTSAASEELILAAIVGCASVNLELKHYCYHHCYISFKKNKPPRSTDLDNVHIEPDTSFLVIAINMSSLHFQDIPHRSSELLLRTETLKCFRAERTDGCSRFGFLPLRYEAVCSLHL